MDPKIEKKLGEIAVAIMSTPEEVTKEFQNLVNAGKNEYAALAILKGKHSKNLNANIQSLICRYIGGDEPYTGKSQDGDEYTCVRTYFFCLEDENITIRMVPLYEDRIAEADKLVVGEAYQLTLKLNDDGARASLLPQEIKPVVGDVPLPPWETLIKQIPKSDLTDIEDYAEQKKPYFFNGYVGKIVENEKLIGMEISTVDSNPVFVNVTDRSQFQEEGTELIVFGYPSVFKNKAYIRATLILPQ